MQLRPLAAERYAREVLPQSAPLWAGARDLSTYVEEFLAITASPFGKRRFRTLGLTVDGTLVASCKRYERTLRCGERRFRAAGIGAVFTPEPLRGRGYATALLGAVLDAERDAGTGVVYLFSDLHPAFYERLGFVALPSRTFSLRADALAGARLEVATLDAADEPALRRTFTALEARRPFAFVRSALDWEWQRLRLASTEVPMPTFTLGVRRGRGIAAYVRGRRLPSADAFAVDELAFTRDGDAELVAPLLRAAAGDLRTVRGWLPPAIARDALPAGAVRRRSDAILMALPLSAAFRAAWRRCTPGRRDPADPVWSSDHV